MKLWEIFTILAIILLLIITIALITPNTEKEYIVVEGHIDAISVGIMDNQINYLNVSINSTYYHLMWGTWVNNIIVNYSDNPWYVIEMYQYTTPPQENNIYYVTTVVIL